MVVVDDAVAARFWAKVAKSPQCWEWTGARIPGGYGSVFIAGRPRGAHRVAWAIAHERWPDGMVLHSCDNPPCVRPDHLREGDNSQNMLDAVSRGSHRQTRKVHCPKGHPYDEQNTYVSPQTGYRYCRECNRLKARAAGARRGVGPANAAKTHCPQGHQYSDDNTGRTATGRRCLACHREQEKRRNEMKRLQRVGA